MYLNSTEENVVYKNNLYFRIMKNTVSVDYPSHWHTALELIMPVENTYTAQVAGQTICLSPGDIFLIASGELHSLTAPANGSRIILQIDCSMLAGFEEFPALLYHLKPYLWITAQRMPDLHQKLSSLLYSITEEYFSPALLREASAYSSLLRFFIILGRELLYQKDSNSFSEISSKKRQEYMEKFYDIIAYINDHCAENPDVEELAAITGFSVSHFSRLFRQFTGMSWYSYLTRQKIIYVERLLASTSLPITEIAMKAGFNSLATFNRIFKAEKHCTPSQYKNKYRF